MMKNNVKVAAVQASPVFLNLTATVEKACGIIAEAADNGAELIVLPEAFIPGYPYWIWLGDPGWGMTFWKRLYKNSVTIPGPAVTRLSETARKHNIYICVSVTERDRGSLYLTQLWFDKEGNLMGKHRKIRPTGVERTIWGEGDGSTMPVFETEIGRLGGLMCWEHMMPTNAVIMDSKNEQIHAASWPAFAWDEKSVHHFETCRLASKYYAIATGTFVVLSSETLSQEAIDEMCGDDEYKRGIYKKGQGAGAQIINPAGKVISSVTEHDQEGISYADIDLDDIIEAKYHMDCAGHYSKGGIVQLMYNQHSQEVVSAMGEEVDMGISYSQLQES